MKLRKIICMVLAFTLIPYTETAYARQIDKVNRLFNPTDIFMCETPDWQNFDVPLRIGGDIFGSPHGPVYFLYVDNEREQIYRNEIASIHANGMKFYMHLTFDPIKEIISQDSKAICRDIDGEIVRLTFGGGNKPIYSFLNPETKEKFLQYIKQCIDIGVDGFCNDNCDFTLTFILSGNSDFSEASIEGFRDYLSRKYSKEVLAELGINDIASFDYKQFLRSGYYEKYKNSNVVDRLKNIPLFKDFYDFQLLAAQKFWKEIITESKTYAKSLGREILFSANPSENCYNGKMSQISPMLPVADTADFFMAEYTFGYPPRNLELVNYKLYNSMGKQVVTIPTDLQTAELYNRPDFSNLMKLYIAEAYATGNYFNLPYMNKALNAERNEFIYYNAKNLEEIYPYYDFINKNPACFENLDSTAEIALYYSTAAMKQEIRRGEDDTKATQGFYGTAVLLQELHYQYDILTAGDGALLEDKYNATDLSDYKLVILPNVREMTDRQVSDILKYVKSGGTVVASGDTGINNEQGQPCNRTKLQKLLKEGKNKYGKGYFIYIKNNIGMDYLNNPSGKLSTLLFTALKEKTAGQGTITADKQVTVIKYKNTDDSSLLLHLLNFNYDTVAGKGKPQTNITISIPVGAGLSGKRLGVYYVSPDFAEIKELEFTVEGGFVKFKVPELLAYGVISIGEKDKFNVLIQTSRSN